MLTELGSQVSRLWARVEQLETENAETESRECGTESREQRLERNNCIEQGSAKVIKGSKVTENYSVEQNKEAENKQGKKQRGDVDTTYQARSGSEQCQSIRAWGREETGCIERRVQYGWRLVEGQAKYI